MAIDYSKLANVLRRPLEDLDRLASRGSADGTLTDNELTLLDMALELSHSPSIPLRLLLQNIPKENWGPFANTLDQYVQRLSNPVQPHSHGHGYITTKGNRVVFKPSDLPDARVLSDGSVMLNERTTVLNGGIIRNTIHKTLHEILVRGSILDPITKTTLSAEDYRIRIENDRYIVTKGVTIETPYGKYTLHGEQFVVSFTAGDAPKISGKNIVITPSNNENVLTLKKGSVILYDTERYQLGVGTEVSFGEENTFSVQGSTHFCFTECNGRDKIVPEYYSLSAIEVLLNRQDKPFLPAVDRLKITTLSDNDIQVQLKNPPYESIYLDAHQGGRIALKQEGSQLSVVDAGSPEKAPKGSFEKYSSKVVASPSIKGGFEIHNPANSTTGGAALLVVTDDPHFSGDMGYQTWGYAITKIETAEGQTTTDNSIMITLQEFHNGRPWDLMGCRAVNTEFGPYLTKGRHTAKEYADIIRRYAADRDLSLEEAYQQCLDQNVCYDDNIATELGLDHEKIERQLVVRDYKEALAQGKALPVGEVTINDPLDMDELSDEEKGRAIENYFRHKVFEKEIGPAFDFYEGKLKKRRFRQYLTDGQWNTLVRGTLDKYRRDESLGLAINLIRKEPQLFTEREREAIERDYAALKARPVYLVPDGERHAYNGYADGNNDGIIDPAEARSTSGPPVRIGPYKIPDDGE